MEKKTISLPRYIVGLSCPSTSCITNQREDATKTFDIVHLEDNIPFMRCRYCEEAFKLETIINSMQNK